MYESLEEVHILALAHVLRRPIIVVADTTLKVTDSLFVTKKLTNSLFFKGNRLFILFNRLYLFKIVSILLPLQLTIDSG